eukprot:SM000174S03357  [mRNA]  locus=s174:128285:131233:- [translate_table: standard]
MPLSRCRRWKPLRRPRPPSSSCWTTSSAPAVTEVPTPSLPEVPTPAGPGGGGLVQGLKASVSPCTSLTFSGLASRMVLAARPSASVVQSEELRRTPDRAKAFKETLAKLRAGRDEAGQRAQEEQDRVQATKTEAESVIERARSAAEKGRSEIASKAAQVKEAAQKKTHGFLPLFLAQILLLAAYGGGVAALVLIPEKQWKIAKQTVGGYTEAVSPAVQGVLGKAQPLASKDFSTKAAPYGAKALESARPIALKAWAGAKPLLGKAARSAGKLLQSAQSQASKSIQEARNQVGVARGLGEQCTVPKAACIACPGATSDRFCTRDRVVVLRAGEEDGIGF